MPARKPTDMTHLKLRFREELRGRVEKSARERDISLNSEIIRRLEASFDHEKERAQVRQDRDYFLQMFKLLLSVRPSAQQRESILEGIEQIERDLQDKDWKAKRLTDESQPTQKVVGQPPQKEHKPRPSRRE
jgi:Arc-like DNA binding domain